MDINAANIAAVTLQENNHIVLVDLATGAVTTHFSARSVNLTRVDTDDNSVIEPTDEIVKVAREPDAIAWTSLIEFATANEGDLDGGSRGFTIFGKLGDIHFDSGSSTEHLAMRFGHYPESRSDNKGGEVEGIEYGEYGNQRLLFVGSERASVIGVYRLPPSGAPVLLQVLPANVGPEGLLAIPQRNLFVSASETDDRAGTIRSTVTIYEWRRGDATYPTILSANGPDGLPIPWGALSGIAGDPVDPRKAYTIHDSYYGQSRIYTVDASQSPAVITDVIVLRDAFGNTFNFDLEGIAARPAGQGFWVVSEGSGSCTAVGTCSAVGLRNLLIDVSPSGTLRQMIPLPAAVNARQTSNGYEGVASVGIGSAEVAYVAFQREWLEDPRGQVRIGRYEVATGNWTFYYYPLDAPTSPNGGWVGLSEIVALDGNTLAVLERDNQAGTDARIKKIYSVSIRGLTPTPQGSAFPVVSKRLVRDLMSDLTSDHGLVIEKVEGVGVLANGDALIVTDNDGVEDSSGETQWLNLGNLFPQP